jgi:hypothetical protein
MTDGGTPTAEAQLASFAARLDPRHQALFRSVRAAVGERFPTANELAYDYGTFFVIAYSPTDKGIVAVVSIAARATGVDLYVNGGPQLPDPKHLLSGSGGQARYMRLDAVSQLADPDVEALLAAAIDRATVPLPPHGEGRRIIKTNRTLDPPKRRRRKPETPS